MTIALAAGSWRQPLSRRLWLALAVSVLAHGLLAQALQSSGGAGRRLADSPALSARLQVSTEAAVPPATVPAAAALPDGGDGLPATALRTPASLPASALAAAPAPASGAALQDNRLYSAAELDRYPVPRQPLDLQAAVAPAAAVRLWVSIDAAGRVTALAAAEPGLAPETEQQLREWLSGIGFSPAIRDERPVRSRILVELRP